MSIDEQVLVIPATVLQSLGAIDGFTRDIDRYLPPILASNELCFRSRREMETDPSFKQLIPYVLLEYKDSAGQPFLFTYTRGGGQGEARLRAKRSFGIGGHISQEDAAGGTDVYLTGMQRELAEEVTIHAEFREHRVGLIYDPSTEVGQVHLGVVHRFELVRPNVQSNEAEVADAAFVSLSELKEQRDGLETWSQICLQHLYG